MDIKNIKLVVFEHDAAQPFSAVEGYSAFIRSLKNEGLQTALLARSADARHGDDYDFYLDPTGGTSLKSLIADTGYHWFNVLFFVSSQALLDRVGGENLRRIVRGTVGDFPSADNLFANFSELDPRAVIEVGRPSRLQADPWILAESEFIPARSPYWESIFSACNGYMGLRATHPETAGAAEAFATPGFFINGYYGIEYPAGYTDRYGQCKSQIMLNLIDWRRIDILIDGRPVTISPQSIASYSRCLDMRTGLVSREVVCRHGDKQIRIEEKKLVSMTRSHCAAILYRVTPLNFEGLLTLRSGLKTDTYTQQFGTTGLKTIRLTAEDDRFAFVGEAEVSGLTMVAAVRHSCRTSASRPTVVGNATLTDTLCQTDFSTQLARGETLALEKHAAFYTDVEPEPLDPDRARQTATAAAGDGFETLAGEQRRFWSEFWAEHAVEIEGNTADLQAVRYNQFMMRQNLPPADNCSISATGLTGAKYKGWIFWDTEIFMAPQFNFSSPARMKQLLNFRYNQLDQARANAEFFCSRGAAYPWSTINGHETNHDLLVSRAQYHISLDIAHAAWLYYLTSDDRDWLMERGLEMLLEISRFFFDLGAFSPALEGKFVINVVCGPDEYSFHVDNNYYTNLLCKSLFENTLKTLAMAREHAPAFVRNLLDRLRVTEAELQQFARAAENMHLPYSEKFGVHEQDSGYLTRNPVDMEKVPRNYEIKQDMGTLEISRRQITKQADLVLAMVLMPDHFSPEAKRRNYQFYEPRTCHASSLSPCAHGILAGDIGNDREAYDYFRQTAYMDLDDFKGNTRDGIHFACSGGTWLMTVAGFAGMRLTEQGLRFDPHLPAPWTRLTFPFYFQGCRLFFDIEPRRCRVELVAGDGCSLSLAGRALRLTTDDPEATVAYGRDSDENKIRGVIFDLDGVIVSTDDLHYRAWKRLAEAEGIPFGRDDNDRLRGVSRMESLEVILEKASRSYSGDAKRELAERKNAIYRDSLKTLSPADILPGVEDVVAGLKAANVKIAIGSSSQNAQPILEAIGMGETFDAVADGTHISRSKPDPEVFQLAGRMLELPARQCLVVEDAEAGVDAALAAGMPVLAVGAAASHPRATLKAPDLAQINLSWLLKRGSGRGCPVKFPDLQ
jgi:alpha,alpha-trehalose phosphorylase